MRAEIEAALRRAEQLSAAESLRALSPLSGSSFHQIWRAESTAGRLFFVKSGSPEAAAMFRAEAGGLEALHRFADSKDLRVPLPIALIDSASGAALVLPWLDLGGGDERALGRGLALLHQASAADSPGAFGWHQEGFIGAGPQPGGWRSRWGQCFVELRLRPQLALRKSWGLDRGTLEVLLEAITLCLDQHAPAPSLVHGDLWAGNMGISRDGRGAIFDPASWWADREVDLAMAQMFSSPSASFLAGYREIYPPSPGEEERVEIYHLFHWLNHANLFGGAYHAQVNETLKMLSRRFC